MYLYRQHRFMQKCRKILLIGNIYAEMSQDSVDRKLKEWNDTWFSGNAEVKEVKKSIAADNVDLLKSGDVT